VDGLTPPYFTYLRATAERTILCVSEDPTKDIGQKYDTDPTLDMVVRMLGELRDETRNGFAAMEKRFSVLETGLSIRLDRIESEVKQTHSELFSLRADFTELRSEFNEFRAEVRERLKEPA